MQLASYDRAKSVVSAWMSRPADDLVTQAAAASVAGGIATACIAPVEFVKTRMQAGKGDGLVAVTRSVLRESGPLAFWRGSGALCAKLAPHTLIVLLATDAFRTALGVPVLL